MLGYYFLTEAYLVFDCTENVEDFEFWLLSFRCLRKVRNQEYRFVVFTTLTSTLPYKKLAGTDKFQLTMTTH
jgi:hypothetical protein